MFWSGIAHTFREEPIVFSFPFNHFIVINSIHEAISQRFFSIKTEYRGVHHEHKFIILHLSDAHLGNPRSSLDSLSVFDPLFKDLKEYSAERKLKPNLIVFSGDLAFGDIHEKRLRDQYTDAKNYLSSIFHCFDTEYGKLPALNCSWEP